MPRKRSQVAEVVAALDASCKATGVRWYLFGAQAALLYGSARLTADVDATVLLGDVSSEALLVALQAGGFQLRTDDAKFVATTRVILVVHTATGLPADVVLGGPGVESVIFGPRGFQAQCMTRFHSFLGHIPECRLNASDVRVTAKLTHLCKRHQRAEGQRDRRYGSGAQRRRRFIPNPFVHG